MLPLLALAALTPATDAPAPAPITVTASRVPISISASGSALSVIDAPVLAALNLPQVKDYLALVPSVSVTQAGPMGSQTQIRIRGAEANHSITFIDGIEVNDPASSGEFRMETLLAQGVERIEVLRGPQSALWGSQAIGGVINILTRRAPETDGLNGFGEAEAGSFRTLRAGGGLGWRQGALALSGQASWLDSLGYDLSGSPGGDRDGYSNLTLHGRADVQATANLRLALIGRYTDSTSQFDSFNFSTGVPVDAPLATASRQHALRAEAGLDLLDGRWTHLISFTRSGADNANRRAGIFQNESDGRRDLLRYQTSFRFDTGAASHRLTAALDDELERFVSVDANAQAASNQRQRRRQTGLVAEYRLAWAWLNAGAALRHDQNSGFADATTVRADAVAQLGGGWRTHASFGTGVADPTFFDQFGFFPGFFRGNPALTPERASSWDLGLGWQRGETAVDMTWYRSNLVNEIIGTFDNVTFLSGVANATGRSRRQGLEVSARTRLAEHLLVNATYAYLDASQQQLAAGVRSREIRRPPHSGSISLIWQSPAFDLAASAAITGGRDDTDFARFATVRLPGYALVTLSGAWHVTKQLDVTARLENALDSRIVDVFAYRNPGLSAHAGVRVRL
ncbi:MAG: TonB-dependent receptor [Sphingomonadales bacterium]|jgi:vitamin B12 transporter